jgi:predicted oxidoreductase
MVSAALEQLRQAGKIRAAGVSNYSAAPLAQGRLGSTQSPQAIDVRAAAVIAALERVAVRASVPRWAVAYAWVMAHPSRPVALIGSQNPARIREPATAYEVQLRREEWYQILEAARGEPLP